MSVTATGLRAGTFSHTETRNEFYTAVYQLDFARLQRDLQALPPSRVNAALNSPIHVEGIDYPNLLDYAVHRLMSLKSTNPDKLYMVFSLIRAGSRILPDSRGETILHKIVFRVPISPLFPILKEAIKTLTPDERRPMLMHRSADGLTVLQGVVQRILHLGGSNYVPSLRLLLEMEGSPPITCNPRLLFDDAFKVVVSALTPCRGQRPDPINGPIYNFEEMPLDQICQILGVVQYLQLLAPRDIDWSTMLDSPLFTQRKAILDSLKIAASKVEIWRMSGVRIKKLLLQLRKELKKLFYTHRGVASPSNSTRTFLSGIRV